jgi:thiamine kinase-like enzyme
VNEKLGRFDVFGTIRHYVALASQHQVQMPGTIADAMCVLDRMERALATTEPECLCHNDLLAGNFLDDGTTMHIIDWEYGGRGDRFFDLGNFAANLKLTAEQEAIFLDGYFGAIRPEQVRRVRLMRAVSDLREATWGFVQQALSSLAAPEGFESYFHYGTVHLERALQKAREVEV